MLRTPAESDARATETSIPATSHTSVLFDRLRAETALAHRDLEARIDLVDESLDVPRYVQLLRNFRSAVAAYEAVAGPALPMALRGMFEARRKTALLDADLLHFGTVAPSPDLADIGRVIGHDAHAAIGAMYVFEGSTLGGAVVARHLEHQLGLCTLQGRRYFTPYPGRTGAMWREFKECVDDLACDDPAACDAIVAAAGATFAWLARVLPRNS
ncbi:MAG: heme oxygenase-like protein [Panacagrimonas sp.]|jgi:heme oxygenase|nr:heme oxygenase-like protein [Panacagrimonas sp.]